MRRKSEAIQWIRRSAEGYRAAHAERIPERDGVRVDLHCHSSFSDETLSFLPGVLFHPLLTPGAVYDLAKSRGMDYVTITDHDTIDGCKALLDERGDLPDFIIGEEVSVQFPQDGTIIHVNVFDHDEDQHRELQRLRGNIYEIVDYLRSIDKLFVLNHMTWTMQHRVLKGWQIEAMLGLFPVFEGINGTRSYAHNAFTWYATRDHDKVLVAGSDSHTNRVGSTYTRTVGTSRAEVLASIRSGQTAMVGEWGTPQKLHEDVWMIIQQEVDRRVSEAETWGRRLYYTAARRLARAIGPLACVGYHRRQDSLIRGFDGALAS